MRPGCGLSVRSTLDPVGCRKDSDLKYYRLPGWATVPGGGSIYVHVGRGRSHGTNFYWGLGHALFDNTIGDSTNVPVAS